MEGTESLGHWLLAGDPQQLASESHPPGAGTYPTHTPNPLSPLYCRQD